MERNERGVGGYTNERTLKRRQGQFDDTLRGLFFYGC